MSEGPNSCVHCISRAFILASCFSGLMPVTFECVRNKKNYFNIPVKISPTLIVISYVHAGILLAGTLYEFYANYDLNKSFWKLNNMEAIAYLLFGMDIDLVMIFSTNNAKYTRDTFIVIAELVNLRGGASNKALFTRMRYRQRNAVMYVGATILVTILAIAYILVMKPVVNLVSVSKMYHYFLFTFIEGWVLGVLIELIELWFENIKETLELNRKNRCKHLCIDKALRELINIRVADYTLLEVSNRFASPPVTIFLFMTIVTEITGLYVTALEIFQWMSGESLSIGRLIWPLLLLPPAYCGNIAKNTANLILGSCLLTYLISLGRYLKSHPGFILLTNYCHVTIEIIFVVIVSPAHLEQFTSNNISFFNDSIVSYLYRIPISHLPETARHQIEVLISILTNQPLIIKASKKFPVSWKVFTAETNIVDKENMIDILRDGLRIARTYMCMLFSLINGLVFGKPAAHLVAEDVSYGWENLTLAVQLLLPLAFIALLFARKKIWIYPYPLLDSYISALCPSFSQQQRLLKWMSSRIPHMNSLPNKINQYWQNGSLLCTLINTVIPGACTNPQKHWRKPPTHGQALAYKYLGVAPVLTEDDFKKPNLTSYSERKFIKYLLSVQDAINKMTIEEDSLRFTSKYVARGMGLVIGEQNRPSCFYVYPNTGSKKIENILVNIKGPYNTFGAKIISKAEYCSDVNKMIKLRKDNLREQQKLEYKSKAQRSFFRSVSFDIGPIMNLVTNKKNAGEISVKVEIEDERAKVTFLPTFSGIYELLLTSDGQHLQGSPFVIRIMKNTKEVEDVLQEKVKIYKGRVERKVIGKTIDFVDGSVDVTDEFSIRLDSNNNANKGTKEFSEPNKSDDESVYQDSGIFDVSDQYTNRSKQLDLEEIDEDTRFSEISDSTAADESKHNSLEYKIPEEEPETIRQNIGSIIEIDQAKRHMIIVHNHMPEDIVFLTNDFDEGGEEHGEKPAPNEDSKREIAIDVQKVSEDIFDEADDSQSNQEFENLYNKYVSGENDEDVGEKIEEGNTEEMNDTQTNDILAPQNEKTVLPQIEITSTNSPEEDLTPLTRRKPAQDEEEAKKIIDDDDQSQNKIELGRNRNKSQLRRGRRLTSSVEKMVEMFEKDSSTKSPTKDDVQLEAVEKRIHHFTCASPVFSNIAQEANVTEEMPQEEDSSHLDRDVQLSSEEGRPKLSRDYSIYLDDDEVYDTNVREIRNIFERKPEVKAPNRRFATTLMKQNGLEESKKKLAKSLPDLVTETARNSLEDYEDEFLVKFKEKRKFWSNLVSQNNDSNFNVSSPEISMNNTKLISKQYQSVSQSANALNTVPRCNKSSPLSKFKKKKEELYKTASLDLGNVYDDEFSINGNGGNKIVRAESLYDRIRIFEKDFDSSRHSTLLKRTKAKSDLHEKPKHAEIARPESLTEVPNTTSNDQIEEDLRFSEIMKERFEISRRYFCSLETINTKPNLTRRHSMDCKRSVLDEVPLQKGGSLKMLNVTDKFALDNIYKDVMLNTMKNSSFMGSPNRDAVVETLSSVSSADELDNKEKHFVEEEDLNLQFFNIKKRLRKRRSIKSIFDVNY